MTYPVDPVELAAVRPGDLLLIGARTIQVSRVVETERPTRVVAGPPLIKKCARLYDTDGDAFIEAPLDEIAHRIYPVTDAPTTTPIPNKLLAALVAAFQEAPDDDAARDELVVDAANAIVHHLNQNQEATR